MLLSPISAFLAGLFTSSILLSHLLLLTTLVPLLLSPSLLHHLCYL
jgi:hypothetical protein